MSSENNQKFKEIPLVLCKPDWGSELAGVVVELEKLRDKKLGGPVPPYIFFQLKNIFQMMESLGSARIEGNNTTLAELVEKVIEKTKEASDEKMKEIFNIERAIDFMEKNIGEGKDITRGLISEIHKIIVDGLTPHPRGEGSRFPGDYRPVPVKIKNSPVVNPEPIQVPGYMEELFRFVNMPTDRQNDLLVTAISHHRLAWIHPFDNGNGRMVRMFTYAMLIKQGFKVKDGRILNPTAIFCMDRSEYYDMLRRADSGKPEDIIAWCSYVLTGLRDEIQKIDRLLDLSYMIKSILTPTLEHALERKFITQQEFNILLATIKNKDMTIRSSELVKIIGDESSVQRSRIIKRLKDKGMLQPPHKTNGRIYTIGFIGKDNYLLRSVFYILEKNGFVPKSLNIKN